VQTTTYFIGDIQGCADQLQQLLTQLEQESKNNYYLFAGDLVNRGPKSLETLRLIYQLQQSGRAESVLGNHDLHLLAVANGIRPAHRGDTLDAILQAPDRDALLEWLRRRPLVILHEQHLLMHAGVYPAWSVAQTLACAAELETVLRSPDWRDFLRQMYGNTPARWDETLTGIDRLRCIANGLTRMRFCQPDGTMDFAIKEGAGAAPAGFFPWYQLSQARRECSLVFGHWASLGLRIENNLISLDSGCIWGGQLSAVALHDRRVVQVDGPVHLR